MPRGHPDFLGTSTFLAYGDVIQAAPIVGAIGAGDTEKVLEITQKAILLGGFLTIYHLINDLDFWVRVVTDGTIRWGNEHRNRFTVIEALDKSDFISITLFDGNLYDTVS